QAAVAGDRVQPGPKRDLRVAVAQRAVGGYKAVLERVLGLVAAAEHVAAECEQPVRVAVVDRLERSIVTGAHTSDQPVVPLGGGEAPAERTSGLDADRGRGHEASMRYPGPVVGAATCTDGDPAGRIARRP